MDLTKKELEAQQVRNDALIAKYEAQDAKRKLYHQDYAKTHAAEIAAYHKTYNSEHAGDQTDKTPEQIEKSRVYHQAYNLTHAEHIKTYHQERNAAIKKLLNDAKKNQ